MRFTTSFRATRIPPCPAVTAAFWRTKRAMESGGTMMVSLPEERLEGLSLGSLRAFAERLTTLLLLPWSPADCKGLGKLVGLFRTVALILKGFLFSLFPPFSLYPLEHRHFISCRIRINVLREPFGLEDPFKVCSHLQLSEKLHLLDPMLTVGL